MSRPSGLGFANCRKAEQQFWENLRKNGDEVELKYARDLPDATPEFILGVISEFEQEVAAFCFSEASGRVLDAGCGNGNLFMRSLLAWEDAEYVGLDFSSNMLRRAAARAGGKAHTSFLQGSVSRLPFQSGAFDRVVSSGVLTCLSTAEEEQQALSEFSRVLAPEGILVVDFFNSRSHFTLIRKHLLKESIAPPEYVSPSNFRADLAEAGFEVLEFRGFDFKPCQGYLFLSGLQPFIDPCFIQERISRLLEARILHRMPALSLLGYRIYVKCKKIQDL